jgi:hypothetical protein
MGFDNLATVALWVTCAADLCLVTVGILWYVSSKSDKYSELHYWMHVIWKRRVLRNNDGMHIFYYIPDIKSPYTITHPTCICFKNQSDVVAECKELVSSYESGEFWLIEPRYYCKDVIGVWDYGSLLDVALWYRDVMYTNIPDELRDNDERRESVLGWSSIRPIAMNIVNQLPVTNIVLIYKVRKMLGGLARGI